MTTVAMSNIKIRDAANAAPSEDPKVIAEDLLHNVLTSDDVIDILAEHVMHYQRLHVLSCEKRVFQSFFKTNTSLSTTVRSSVADIAFQLSGLFDKEMKLGDGTSVTWGKATIEQHEQRIAVLEKIRDGIDDTISRHREAISILQKAKAKCLEEI